MLPLLLANEIVESAKSTVSLNESLLFMTRVQTVAPLIDISVGDLKVKFTLHVSG